MCTGDIPARSDDFVPPIGDELSFVILWCVIIARPSPDRVVLVTHTRNRVSGQDVIGDLEVVPQPGMPRRPGARERDKWEISRGVWPKAGSATTLPPARKGYADSSN
jgi:hypothetical protein